MVCQKIGLETGDRLSHNARKLKYLVTGPLPSVNVFPKFQVRLLWNILEVKFIHSTDKGGKYRCSVLVE